jgi:cellulose synthase/poly-beta-1,6-N-acetylglucosamine synthase-like glycosyltransferase
MSLLLLTFAGLVAFPVFLFYIEVIAAVTVPQRELSLAPKDDLRRRIAVLVPAHNESVGLRNTLEDIKRQLRIGDRVLVVADNCSDDTALIAQSAGVEVIERHDPGKIGKGYALDWGLRYFTTNPPEIIIIIDADCRLANNTLDRLAVASAATGRPTQALNLMTAPAESRINFQVAEFAFRVKNWVRPLGLRALNLPCQLMGTGMAFPWDVLRSVDLASGHAVEDLKLGLDLARVGKPPLFCPSAGVNSLFPLSAKGAESQRKRWEQGHLGMIATTIPRLMYKSLTQGNLRLLALTLDAAVPPLTLLGMLVSLMLLVSGFGVLLGLSSSALVVSAASWSAYLVAVLLCWWKFGRDILPLSSTSSVFFYVADKLPLYRQIFARSGGSKWIRTDRDGIGEDVN